MGARDMPRFPFKTYPRGQVVYWIGEPVGLLPIKVGHSKRVDRRVREIQTGCPVRIALLAYLVGGVGLEKEIHGRLSSARVHGEWFVRDYALTIAREYDAVFLVG